MSRFSDSKTAGRRGAAVALIAALACTGATLASDDPLDAVTVRVQGAEPPGEARSASGSDHTPEERPAPAPGKSAKSPRSLFRCWQGGRMIFEGRGYGALPQSQIAAELKAVDGASGRVQVLDMFEGLCVLELPK